MIPTVTISLSEYEALRNESEKRGRKLESIERALKELCLGPTSIDELLDVSNQRVHARDLENIRNAVFFGKV